MILGYENLSRLAGNGLLVRWHSAIDRIFPAEGCGRCACRGSLDGFFLHCAIFCGPVTSIVLFQY